MKLTIQQDVSIPETEVILRCPVLDARLESLISHIRQYSFVLVGYQEQREFHLPLESIYYMDSTDGRTFLYQKDQVYQCRETLAALEGKLCQTTFVRISKSCIVNTAFLQHVEPHFNHRLKAVLKNGEQLIITRSYIDALRRKLKGGSVS
ncbi:LytTR family DNA-binding domain-containing protein [Pseudoflavonifractor sp. An85]|uniref:LytTR family DNA-binding domain-containing protein n=1 Tax=Pseudoflavonifractor sp. An85 TaxID=1965661 RepID=UPI000B387508|nr:LytTR family DNA-binding domain-containing protein [Pseudoflavonifractor sp. An85]OUN19388.1 LytTR family transcriptional regulator [Pseudoflavonifractor sp. An85]